jgi:hypothetical protein
LVSFNKINRNKEFPRKKLGKPPEKESGNTGPERSGRNAGK